MANSMELLDTIVVRNVVTQVYSGGTEENLDAVAVLLSDVAHEKILLVKLVGDGWDIPGGRREATFEQPRDILAREIIVETGLFPHSYQYPKLVGTLVQKNEENEERVVGIYHAHVDEPTPVLHVNSPDTVLKAKWARLSKIPKDCETRGWYQILSLADEVLKP